MEAKNLQILKCKRGITQYSMDYFNNLDSHNYRVEDTELPHPDLINAFKTLRPNLSRALYANSSAIDNFDVLGFTIDERDDVQTVEIRGKVKNPDDYFTNVSSGKIPLDGLVLERVDVLRAELFAYFFGNKRAQQDLPFEGNGTDVKTQQYKD